MPPAALLAAGTTTPRAAPRRRSARASRRRRAAVAAARASRATHGRPSAAAAAAAARRRSGASSTSGSRSGKFRCTGPGRPLERRPHGAAGQRADPAQALGRRPRATPTSTNHFDRVAVELDLVDRLPGAGVAQLGRAVGGQHDQRHARLARLDDGGQVVGGRRPRRAGQRPPGARWPWPGRARRSRPQRSSTCEKHGKRPSRTSASTSGVEREPGRRAGARDAAARELVGRARAAAGRCRGLGHR